MIIWLNGCFGSGKTSVAKKLQSMFEVAYIYDPEEVGQFIRMNLPDGNEYNDFQDHPLWRKLNYEILRHTVETTKEPVIVPMTIVDASYHNEIVGGLKNVDADIRQYSLLASEDVICERLIERGDALGSWAFKQVTRCCDYLKTESHSRKVNTDKISINEVAKLIFDDIDGRAL